MALNMEYYFVLLLIMGLSTFMVISSCIEPFLTGKLMADTSAVRFYMMCIIMFSNAMLSIFMTEP